MTSGYRSHFDRLEKEAAQVRAIQPSTPIHLGIIPGYLTYVFMGSKEAHVTGVAGDVYRSDSSAHGQDAKVTLYDILTEGSDPVTTKINIWLDGAWAD